MMKKRITAGILIGFFLILFIDIQISLHFLTVKRYEIKDSNLPASFSGYKIAQISDLHNAVFGAFSEASDADGIPFQLFQLVLKLHER